MEDKRRTARQRVLKAGTIEFGGGAINCVARNLSESGAALEVESPVGIPDVFQLVISADRGATAAWRGDGRNGSAFVSLHRFVRNNGYPAYRLDQPGRCPTAEMVSVAELGNDSVGVVDLRMAR